VSDEDHIAPVVQLVPGRAPQNKVAGHGYAFCRHPRTLIDADTREVSCRDCTKTLDAVDVLLEYAHRERTWHHWDQDTRLAQKRLAELQAEERKVKARTKSAARKDADVAVAAERKRTETMRYEIWRSVRDIQASCARIERLVRRPGEHSPEHAQAIAEVNTIRAAIDPPEAARPENPTTPATAGSTPRQ
jgi:hypothetical protein